MKRLVIILLVLIISVLPLNTYAKTNSLDEVISKIEFEDIGEEIVKRNPTVIMNNNILETLKINLIMLKDNADDIEDALYKIDYGRNNMDVYLRARIEKLKQDQASLKSPRLSDIYPEDPDEPGTPLDPEMEKVEDILQSYYDALYMQYEHLIGIYQGNLNDLYTNLESSKEALTDQSKTIDEKMEDMEDSIEKFEKQCQMTASQLTWAAESLFINYHMLDIQESNLKNNLELLEKQIEVSKIRKVLGLATEMDVIDAELQLAEAKTALENLKTQKVALLGELNLLFGQKYINTLELGSAPLFDEVKINDINFSTDREEALKNNYSIILQDMEAKSKELVLKRANDDDEKKINNIEILELELENEKIKLEETVRQTELSLYKLYKDLQSKKQSVYLSRKQLDQAEKSMKIAEIRYELGLISRVMYDTELKKLSGNKLDTMIKEYELFLAYRKYEWMKRGLTL